MREGRETYSEKYEEAVRLHKKGVAIPEIAKNLGVSYSAAYHWVRGIRRPDAGNIRSLENFLMQHGPVNAADVKGRFPKHNEIFLTAKRRGLPLFRYVMKNTRMFGEHATWYFLKGQEDELKSRIRQLIREWKLRKMKDMIKG